MAAGEREARGIGQSPVTAWRDRMFARAFPVLVAILGAVTLAGLWRVVAILTQHVPLDPDEGWNAYHTVAAMSGSGPYPAADSLMTNNYPPVSFYVVGLLGRLLGDYIIAGRLVSLAAFLVVSFGVAKATRTMGCTRLEAAFAALFFAAFLLLFTDYVAMDDPQLLGHALQISGLLIVLAEPGRTRSLLAAALLFVLAGFVKHNLVALPLAVLVWLAIYDRRHAARFAASLALFTALAFGAFRLGFGFDLLDRLIAPRSYSLGLLWDNLGDWLLFAGLPLGVLTLMSASLSRDRYVVLCGLYALVGIIIGGLILGGAGVDVNAMFDADIALALGAGLAINRSRYHAKQHREPIAFVFAAVLSLPFALGLGMVAQTDWLQADFWLHPMSYETDLAEQDISFLHSATGQAMCETLSFCYWAGKPAAVDVFNLDQQFLTHSRNDGAFIAKLDAHEFRIIEFDSPAPFPFPPRVRDALARGYRVDHTDDDGVFLVPK
jgi:hypothetical protein